MLKKLKSIFGFSSTPYDLGLEVVEQPEQKELVSIPGEIQSETVPTIEPPNLSELIDSAINRAKQEPLASQIIHNLEQAKQFILK